MNALPEEQLLQEIEDEQPGLGTAVVAPDGHWLKVSPYLCQMLGYDMPELLTMTFQEITYPDDLASEQPYLQRLIAGALDHYQFKKRYVHKDKHIVWGMLDRSVVRDSAGRAEYFISRIRDITEEMQAEAKKSGTFFKRLRAKFRRN